MSRRTSEEWEKKFICIKSMMQGMDDIWEQYHDKDLIVSYATMLRNPLIFDNNVKEVKHLLPYHIEGMKNNTQDHLIGISNTVLYIFKNKLHKSWVTVEDFKRTLKSLNVLLPVSKKLNDTKVYKYGWKFDLDNIDECLEWDKKLKSVGVDYLVHNETNEKVSVESVKDEWYKTII